MIEEIGSRIKVKDRLEESVSDEDS